MATDIRVRPAADADAAAVIGVFLRARARMTYLPRLHSGEETAAHFSERVLPDSEVWVAELDDRVVGAALLDAAIAGRTCLELWVFQKNARARAFYERHGWRLLYSSDGSGNEEKEPDARYRWTASR